MDALINDIRYGFRMLLKNWSFTLIAVIALALGIGGTTALFSVVNEILVHPLPFPDADRILVVEEGDRTTGEGGGAFSPPNYLDVASSTKDIFSQIAGTRNWAGNLTGGSRPERVSGTMTTSSLFPLFGIQPLIGRYLQPQDEKPGFNHVVVLGHSLWKRRYGEDRTIVGKKVFIDNEPYTIVGVMPPNFSSEEMFGDLFLTSPWGVPNHPLAPFDDPHTMRDRHYMDVYARLKPGITIERARAQGNVVGKILEKNDPKSNRDKSVVVELLKQYEDRKSTRLNSSH